MKQAVYVSLIAVLFALSAIVVSCSEEVTGFSSNDNQGLLTKTMNPEEEYPTVSCVDCGHGTPVRKPLSDDFIVSITSSMDGYNNRVMNSSFICVTNNSILGKGYFVLLGNGTIPVNLTIINNLSVIPKNGKVDDYLYDWTFINNGVINQSHRNTVEFTNTEFTLNDGSLTLGQFPRLELSLYDINNNFLGKYYTYFVITEPIDNPKN
jgi:hypothetical protein